MKSLRGFCRARHNRCRPSCAPCCTKRGAAPLAAHGGTAATLCTRVVTQHGEPKSTGRGSSASSAARSPAAAGGGSSGRTGTSNRRHRRRSCTRRERGGTWERCGTHFSAQNPPCRRALRGCHRPPPAQAAARPPRRWARRPALHRREFPLTRTPACGGRTVHLSPLAVPPLASRASLQAGAPLAWDHRARHQNRHHRHPWGQRPRPLQRHQPRGRRWHPDRLLRRRGAQHRPQRLLLRATLCRTPPRPVARPPTRPIPPYLLHLLRPYPGPLSRPVDPQPP
jgi:hypothetical protein